MENFVVSARKYRPSTFESVVGQKALTQTLKNTIKSNHLAHAYLFCGPRGVGKTTCARIFAKTINCENLTNDFEPCNQCESCKAFNEQRSFNIHELDAASNNSVDDIRSIIDQVRIPPQIGKYSVYIVDEVHMLSQGAFNAFLKTLEEPPAHAIFILATTEKHKILPTILSRCQIYEFNRITINDTIQHLANIAQKEGVSIETDALHTIALKSDGGMRDALSIFDQLVNFCGNNISYQDTIKTLNVLDRDNYFRLLDICMQGNVINALLLLNDILAKGFDGQHFVDGFASHIRDVMVSKDPATIQLLPTADTIALQYKKQAESTPLPFLYKALQLTSDCSFNYRLSRNKRLAVELLLIKLCQINNAPAPTPTTPIQPPTNHVNQPTTGGNTPSSQGAPIQKNTQVASQTQTPKPAPRPTQAQAKPAVQRPQSISISISKSTTTPKETQSNEPNATPTTKKRSNTFNFEQLQKAWVASIEQIAQEDGRLVVIMRKHFPQLIGETVIRLDLDNESQVNNMRSAEKELIPFLRNTLQNDFLTVEYLIREQQESAPYTSEDKMKYFIKNNPHVATLKNALNLQIE